MNNIDLKQYEPQAHPAKAVLKKHGVPMTVVSNYLGINYPYACCLLRGTMKMPQHHQEKLDALVTPGKHIHHWIAYPVKISYGHCECSVKT